MIGQVQIGVVLGIETHDLHGAADRRRFPEDRFMLLRPVDPPNTFANEMSMVSPEFHSGSMRPCKDWVDRN